MPVVSCLLDPDEIINIGLALVKKRKKDQKISEELIGIVFFCILNL